MLGGKQYTSELQDTHCIFKDDYTFCNYVDKNLKHVVKIIVYNNNSVRLSISDPKDINSVLAEISRNKNVLTKSSNGNKSLISFKKELECNYLIYNNIGHKFHNVREAFKYKNVGVLGLQISYNNKQDTFHLFIDNDFTYLTDVKQLTQSQYSNLVEDITEQLREFNKAEIQHNDVKPEKIVYSNKNKRFLLVGWEYAHETSAVPTKIKHIGNKVFNHPLKYYLAGFPRMLSLKFMSFELMSSKYKWIKQLPVYTAFKSFVDSSFDFIISKYGHMSSKELHKRFSKHFDMFSFGMVVLFYGSKHKLDLPTKAIDTMFKEFTPKYVE